MNKLQALYEEQQKIVLEGQKILSAIEYRRLRGEDTTALWHAIHELLKAYGELSGALAAEHHKRARWWLRLSFCYVGLACAFIIYSFAAS